MLITQITPFMFIVAKTKGAQHERKGQCFNANRLEKKKIKPFYQGHVMKST